MIADLKAAIDRRRKTITIVTPGLLSDREGQYGMDDLGVKGLRNFLYWNHGSSRFLRGERATYKPRSRDVHFVPAKETLLLEE